MTYNTTFMIIRAKKLGVLILDAREAAHKSVDECARALGITPEQFTAFELGEASPSLPQLEVLAYYLNIPLDHFWGSKTISEDHSLEMHLDLEQLIGLRQRMIGALIRQARLQSDLSLEEVAVSVGMSAEELEACEMGEAELPLPKLEGLSALIGQPIEEFMDQHGPVGTWASQQRAVHEFLNLPNELQVFVSKPINRPYLELAQRLSEMSVEKLRSVGEGILEITL
jgi:transcriptional regulator with XRE-family HTH domain